MHVVYPASLQVLYSKISKQMMQIEHIRIKYPDWQEAAPAGYLQAWQ